MKINLFRNYLIGILPTIISNIKLERARLVKEAETKYEAQLTELIGKRKHWFTKQVHNRDSAKTVIYNQTWGLPLYDISRANNKWVTYQKELETLYELLVRGLDINFDSLEFTMEEVVTLRRWYELQSIDKSDPGSFND
jgi:hypothetical protein